MDQVHRSGASTDLRVVFDVVHDQASRVHQVFRDNRTSAEGQASGYDRSSGRQASSDYWSLIDYQPLVDYLNRRAFTIVDVWLICLFIQLSRLMGGLYGIGRLRRTGTRPSDKWNDTLLLLSGQLGVKRKVSLLESALIKVPSASGFFRPVILIPLGILSNLPAEQVETILLHELAHIKRGEQARRANAANERGEQTRRTSGANKRGEQTRRA